MQFCNSCLNVRDSAGYTISDRLRRAGEFCQKGSVYGNDAYKEIDSALSTLQSKGGCLNCIDGMRQAKSTLADML